MTTTIIIIIMMLPSPTIKTTPMLGGQSCPTLILYGQKKSSMVNVKACIESVTAGASNFEISLELLYQSAMATLVGLKLHIENDHPAHMLWLAGLSSSTITPHPLQSQQLKELPSCAASSSWQCIVPSTCTWRTHTSRKEPCECLGCHSAFACECLRQAPPPS